MTLTTRQFTQTVWFSDWIMTAILIFGVVMTALLIIDIVKSRRNKR